MNIVLKFVLLAALLIGNYILMQRLHVEPIAWSSFLPKHTTAESTSVSLNVPEQYLFCALPDQNVAEAMKREGSIQTYRKIEPFQDLYLLTFQTERLERVMKETAPFPRSGTSMVCTVLFEDFFGEITDYSMYVFPVVLAFLLLFIPLGLWLNILIELSLYLLALTAVLMTGWFHIDSASLLSVIFLVIFALTLINYLYADGMDPKRLFFGIQISVVATMVSAVFLIFSKFGLIHSFGVMLMIGLMVLHFYMNLRIYIMKRFPPSTIHIRTVPAFASLSIRNMPWYLHFVTVALLLSGSYWISKPVEIDLNILNILPAQSEEVEKIKQFESRYLPSLPFIVRVSAVSGKITDVHNAKMVHQFHDDLGSVLKSGKIIASMTESYRHFSSGARHRDDPALWAQFLLLNDLSPNVFPVCSPDRCESDIIVTVPITFSTKETGILLEKISEMAKNYPGLSVSVHGKVTDFDYFIDVFIHEFIVGLMATLILTAIFFGFYCKNVLSVSTILFSAVSSLSVLWIFHFFTGRDFTILTLLDVILYAGLITDSLIQLFVCYKREGKACEHSVLQPVFISNFSILIGLSGMIFSGGLLRAFALDLTLLLGANLIFIIWIVPLLHRHYFKACNG